MVGRVLLLVAAVVVAGLGALLVFLYANQADERAIADLEPVTVLVAQDRVTAGTTLAQAQSDGAFAEESRPAAAVPPGYDVDLTDREQDVITSTLYPGEVLISQKLGDPTSLRRLPIPEGKIGASFTFGDPNRVGDFVAPGSRVAVFVTFQPRAGAVDPATGQPVAPGSQTTQLLLGDASVIAVGDNTTETVTRTGTDGQSTTTQVNRALLTLALTQEQTEKLILAQTIGELYLGLLNDTSVVTEGDGATLGNLFEAGAP